MQSTIIMKFSTKKCYLTREDFQEKVSDSWNSLHNDQDFCDVTLVCEDNQQIKAHKVVLSSSSLLLKNMLKTVIHSHPLLYFWDVKKRDLSKIVDFIYTGQVEIYQSDLEEFLNISAKLEIQGITDKKIDTEITTECDIADNDTKKESFTDHEETYKTEDLQMTSLDTDFESGLAYTTDMHYAEISSLPLLNHDINKTNKLHFKNNQTQIIKYSGLKRRGPIWKYFLEDKTDRSFVFCTTCQRRLSRGKPGNPASKFYIAGMRRHLKTHKDMWKMYVQFKDSHQTENTPKSIVKLNKPALGAICHTEEKEDSLLDQNEDNSQKDSKPLLDENNKIIKLHTITTKVGIRRGPIWNFFQEDSFDITSVTCNICERRISRGRSGVSHGRLTSTPMISHLKKHPVEFGLYTDCKAEKENQKAYTTQSKILLPLPNEINNSRKEAEDKAWTFFDRAESTPRVLLCQVGECTAQISQDTSGSWSLGVVKDHLFTHGYKD